VTTFYNFRNREYSPELGRWLQRDPLDFEGADSNLYRYVGNNPCNRTDPSGLKLDCPPELRIARNLEPSWCRNLVDPEGRPFEWNGCTLSPQEAPDGTPFEPACNIHDICYETCGKTQEQCDNAFYENLKSLCAIRYGLRVGPLDPGMQLWLARRFRECLRFARNYWLGVVNGGFLFFEPAQEDYCVCKHI
jgi:hypothetical protein